MKFTEELKDKINEDFNNECMGINPLELNIDNTLGGAEVFKGNWAVCQVDEISSMIFYLQKLQNVIKEAGVIV